MVRSPSFRSALGAAIGTLALLTGPSAGAAPAPTTPTSTPPTVAPTVAPATRVAEPLEPLEIELSAISPSVVPRTGPIRISGTVTNTDSEPWSAINLYPFIGDEPMTGTEDLEAATQVPVGQEVGGRITDFGTFETIRSLAPGASYSFTLTVPRSYYDLPRPGVYWFGVHALGEGPVPRDTVADGRARTFLPYVPPRVEGSIETSLVIPLRRLIAHEPDGSLARTEAWASALEPGGRLRGLVDFGVASGFEEVTWLIDPALLDAVRRLAAGNPARSLAPTRPADPPPGAPADPDAPGSTTSSPSITLSPSTDAEGGPEGTEGGEDGGGGSGGPGKESTEPLDPTVAALAEKARDWLTDLEAALPGDQVLTLPYGDVDVTSSAEHDPRLYDLAADRTSAVLASWGVSSTPAVASPSGFIDAAGIDLATSDSTVLVTDRMLGTDPPAVAQSGGRRLVVTSSGAASGGPLPGDRLSTIAMRQRLLSEAAVRVLKDDDQPLVMMLPVAWNPEDVGVFFDGLTADWLDLTSVAGASDEAGTVVDTDSLDYPRSQTTRALDASTFTAVESLITAGGKLQNLLTRNDQVASIVTDQALSGASYAARSRPRAARAATNASLDWIEERLGAVEVDAPPGVTLAAAKGTFGPTVTNGLDEPVTVIITARSDAGIVVSDSEEIQLGPDSQTTILLSARTLRLGVHSVTLFVTDIDGQQLGSSDQLPIRSGQVSTVIWVIMASGAGILMLAIGARLVRRFRHRHDPVEEHAT